MSAPVDAAAKPESVAWVAADEVERLVRAANSEATRLWTWLVAIAIQVKCGDPTRAASMVDRAINTRDWPTEPPSRA